MPRVLTVYYKHKPGGFCNRLQKKIFAYLNQGWTVHYISVEPFPYNHPNLIFHILPTPFKTHDNLLFWLYFFTVSPWYIGWVAYKQKIKLLSIFSLTYACLCAPAKWITRTPLLTFIRTRYEEKDSKIVTIIERLLEKVGIYLSDSLIANSKTIKIELEKRNNHNKNIQIIYNNISPFKIEKKKYRQNILKEFSLKRDSFIITTTGLFIKRKNLLCLLKAFAKTKSTKAVLILIGDGPLFNWLQGQSKKLGVMDKVIFAGWRQDVLEILPGCDLFIFPSFLEGLSNSILEAMTCNLPCLVSDISENREIISNTELHFPVDQPDILSKKINEVLQSQDKLEHLHRLTMVDQNRFVFDWENKIIEKAEKVIALGT
jgi:glycosyltransferase involved in cell wall biosynthesis